MEENYCLLIKMAMEGINKGFYANSIPKRRYGAAVFTKNGKIYNSGQYSSFNHITSIHAEMSAVVTATMMEESEITALALVCTENIDTLPKSCGVCLQFIKEHCERTGIDMNIIRASMDGHLVEVNKISEITKDFW